MSHCSCIIATATIDVTPCPLPHVPPAPGAPGAAVSPAGVLLQPAELPAAAGPQPHQPRARGVAPPGAVRLPAEAAWPGPGGGQPGDHHLQQGGPQQGRGPAGGQRAAEGRGQTGDRSNVSTARWWPSATTPARASSSTPTRATPRASAPTWSWCSSCTGPAGWCGSTTSWGRLTGSWAGSCASWPAAGPSWTSAPRSSCPGCRGGT